MSNISAHENKNGRSHINIQFSVDSLTKKEIDHPN